MSEKTLTLRLALLAAIVASYDGLPANSALGNLLNMAPSPDSISEFRVRAGLAIATDRTACADVNLKAGTVGAVVEVPAHAAETQAHGNAVTNATRAQVINGVPNVTAGSLVLRHAAERRPAAHCDVHHHFRRSINDRQSASAS